MGWKETCAVDERMRFVMAIGEEEASFAVLCRRFGVSRKTGYKWLSRYEAEGVPGLVDRSRAPAHHPQEGSGAIAERCLGARGRERAALRRGGGGALGGGRGEGDKGGGGAGGVGPGQAATERPPRAVAPDFVAGHGRSAGALVAPAVRALQELPAPLQ